MGLAAAYQAVCDGHQVTVLEASGEPGGMAAHFDFGGLSLERFYHFVCRSDYATFKLLDELHIADKMRWKETSMGFYTQGQLIPWGNPFALLRVPRLSLLAKLRYAFFVFTCVHRRHWPALETVDAKTWITRWCGQEGYNRFWRSLMENKFHQYADNISASWIRARIRRIGQSRKSIMQEELGYIEGGSQTLVDALVKALTERGCEMHYNCPVERLLIAENRITGVRTPQREWQAQHVISTIPIPLVPKLLSSVDAPWTGAYERIRNIGVCCIVLKLRRSVTPNFWTNVEEDPGGIPGVIEFSNLREMGTNIVYVPYYLPIDHPKFAWPDAALIEESMECLKRLNPQLTNEDIQDAGVFRLKYAQTICEVNFASLLPPVQTPIYGLQIADTCFYYPEDRGISESVQLGRDMARNVSKAKATSASAG